MPALGQPFDPAAGQPGSKAVGHDDGRIARWATEVQSIKRGFQDIAKPALGLATTGTPDMAIGPALSGGVVSLGDGGEITLEFNPPIINGSGPDFAVFENGFSDDFLELAHVAVSTDGEQFYTFPSESLTDTATQIGAFDTVNPTWLHNLAGKYRAGFGTPFELDDIESLTSQQRSQIRFVRITDVVGSIGSTLGTRDSKGRIINDPYPTPYPSGGFDLDAVAVLHAQNNNDNQADVILTCNFLQAGTGCEAWAKGNFAYQLYDSHGRKADSGNGYTGNNYLRFAVLPGVYRLRIRTAVHSYLYKLCII